MVALLDDAILTLEADTEADAKVDLFERESLSLFHKTTTAMRSEFCLIEFFLTLSDKQKLHWFMWGDDATPTRFQSQPTPAIALSATVDEDLLRPALRGFFSMRRTQWAAELLFKRLTKCLHPSDDNYLACALLVLDLLKSSCYRDLDEIPSICVKNSTFAYGAWASRALASFPDACTPALREAVLQWPVVIPAGTPSTVYTVPVAAATIVTSMGAGRREEDFPSYDALWKQKSKDLSRALGRNPALVIASFVSVERMCRFHIQGQECAWCRGIDGVGEQQLEDLDFDVVVGARLSASGMESQDVRFMHDALSARVWRIDDLEAAVDNDLDIASKCRYEIEEEMPSAVKRVGPEWGDLLAIHLLLPWHAFITPDRAFMIEDGSRFHYNAYVLNMWEVMTVWAERWSPLRKAWATVVLRSFGSRQVSAAKAGEKGS
jgi:hypothetical protein